MFVGFTSPLSPDSWRAVPRPTISARRPQVQRHLRVGRSTAGRNEIGDLTGPKLLIEIQRKAIVRVDNSELIHRDRHITTGVSSLAAQNRKLLGFSMRMGGESLPLGKPFWVARECGMGASRLRHLTPRDLSPLAIPLRLVRQLR